MNRNFCSGLFGASETIRSPVESDDFNSVLFSFLTFFSVSVEWETFVVVVVVVVVNVVVVVVDGWSC